MNDANKLKTVITSLESQAEKVKEFSGAISAVNQARKEIDETKSVLKENSKQFLDGSQKSFNQLNTRVASLEERLGKIEQNQVQFRELINSLDIVSPRDLANMKKEISILATENVDALKRHIDIISTQYSQKLSSKMTLILLISGVAILGVGALYIRLVIGL